MGLEIINNLKKQKGFTSERLSNESGVPIGTLNKILNGQTKNPAYETVVALAKALNCSVDDFNDTSNKENIESQTKTLTKDETELLDTYNKLNYIGKREAKKRVNELTMVPNYIEEKKEYLIPFAAHDKEDIDKNSDTYEEYNKHDIDIMMNDDEWK